MNSGKETITLRWSMDDESWSHWTQGRGKQTASAVVLEGLHEIRKNPQAAKKIAAKANDFCERSSREESDTKSAKPPHKIEIQLPAADWGEVCQQVGNPGNPVSTSHLLAAVICTSESWQQVGNDDAEFSSGYRLVDLDSSLSSLATKTAGFSLGGEARGIAWIVAGATFVTAVATVAIAVAAFLAL